MQTSAVLVQTSVVLVQMRPKRMGWVFWEWVRNASAKAPGVPRTSAKFSAFRCGFRASLSNCYFAGNTCQIDDKIVGLMLKELAGEHPINTS